MILPSESAGGETPQAVLQEALQRADKLPDHTKCLVLFINDFPGTYDVRYNSANLTCSQITLACNYMAQLMMGRVLKDRPDKIDE